MTRVRVRNIAVSAAIFSGLFFSLTLSATGASGATGALKCPLVVADHESSLTRSSLDELEHALSGSWQDRRQGVFDYLKRNPQLPAYQKMTKHGLVPVILVNKETYALAKPLLENSVGYGIELKPDSGDHGMMRLEETMIDFGRSGDRKGPNNPELNRTGIAWKQFDGMLPWRRVIVQNSYLMPKEDRLIVRYYHAARRAGSFRTRFGWLRDDELDWSVLNQFPDIYENCYGFCKSDTTQQMQTSFNAEMMKYGGHEWRAIVATPQGQAFLKTARHKMMTADAYDPPALQWKSVEPFFYDSGLASLFPAHLSQMEKEIVSNLIVADDAVSQYEKLLRRYEVSGHHGFEDLETEPVSFLMVEADPSVTADFIAGRFQSGGTFFHLTTEGQAPLGQKAKP